MNDIIVKILIELLSTISLAIQRAKQGRLSELYPFVIMTLSNTTRCRETWKEASWRERYRSGPKEIGQVDTNRSPNDSDRNTGTRIWSCEEYQGCYGWYALITRFFFILYQSSHLHLLGGNILIDDVHRTLGMYHPRVALSQLTKMPVLIQQLANDMNKSRRASKTLVALVPPMIAKTSL